MIGVLIANSSEYNSKSNFLQTALNGKTYNPDDIAFSDISNCFDACKLEYTFTSSEIGLTFSIVSIDEKTVDIILRSMSEKYDEDNALWCAKCYYNGYAFLMSHIGISKEYLLSFIGESLSELGIGLGKVSASKLINFVVKAESISRDSMMNNFKEMTVSEFNSKYSVDITDDMDIDELTDYIDDLDSLNYAYASYSPSEVISDCKEYEETEGISCTYILINEIYIGLY